MTRKLLQGITEVARQIAKEMSAELLGIEDGAKHLRVRFRCANGREVTGTTSKTPRDEKNTLNFSRQQFRRLLLASC